MTRIAQIIVLMLAIALAVALLATPATAQQSRPPQFWIPIICKLNKTCFVQNYVDADATRDALDYGCGFSTYNRHAGTDFRVLSTSNILGRRRALVIAAAPGIVKATRDGEEDKLVRVAAMGKLLRGRECGNAVIIDHGGGWESQYCHLREGSVKRRVRKGMRVKRGQIIGLVGISGFTQFPHLHFTVRHRNRIVDPFTGIAAPRECSAINGPGDNSLWAETARQRLEYREGQFIEAGFAGDVPSARDLEEDRTSIAPLQSSSDSLIFYMRLINLREGDEINIRIDGPTGTILETAAQPPNRNKALYFAYAGRRRTDGAWPLGRYTATAELVRDGQHLEEIFRDILVTE